MTRFVRLLLVALHLFFAARASAFDAPPDYAVRTDGWLTVLYPSGLQSRVDPLFHEANEAKRALADDLGQPVLSAVEVRIARSPDEMARLAPAGFPPPPYASGVTYLKLRLVLLSMLEPKTNAATDLDEVLRHELAHAALEEAVEGHVIPRWFAEGLAIRQSGEHPLLRVRTLWDATLSRTLLPIEELDSDFPVEHPGVGIAYAESADFVRFLLRDEDRARFQSLIARVRDGTAFDRALTDAYGSDVRKLEYQWRRGLDGRFSAIPMLTGGSVLWLLAGILLVAGYVRRRRHAKAKLRQWEHEEVIEAAARDEEQWAAANTRSQVEHAGTWHTLH
ncbi:MAG: peptidase MA family metallohydrolase [Myxococcales bacterium]